MKHVALAAFSLVSFAGCALDAGPEDDAPFAAPSAGVAASAEVRAHGPDPIPWHSGSSVAPPPPPGEVGASAAGPGGGGAAPGVPSRVQTRW